MVTAWQQERRRKQAQGLKSEAVAGLEALLSGVGGIADEQERQKRAALLKQQSEAKTASDAAELERRKARDAADLAMEREKMGAEQARAERLERAAVLRAKGEESQRASVLRQKQTEDALENLKRRAAGGASEEDLRRVAMSDEALGELDDDAVRAVMLEAQGEERERAAKEEKAGAEADAARALATQRLRPKAGPGRGAKPLTEAQILENKKKQLEIQKLEKELAGGGAKAPKPSLTPTEVQGVIELQGARGLLDQLGSMKERENIDTGPIANAIDWMRSKVGVGDPKRVEFKALVGTQIAEYIKSISGATVSEPERAQLLQNVPTANDNDEAFMAKLATVKRLLDNKLATTRRAFEATGRSTTIFDRPTVTSGDDEFDSLPD
jgi:hypothetical protein